MHFGRRLLADHVRARLSRVHGLSLGQVGVQYGIASGVAGIVGLLIVGRLADRLSTRDPRWLLSLTMVMIAALLPFSSLAFLVKSSSLAICFLALSYVVGIAYMAPSIAAIQRLAPVAQRATASAVLLFFSAIVGAAGPFLTGVISDTPVTGYDPLHVPFNFAAFGFDKLGPGTMVINQNNTFNGDSFVSAGKVIAQDPNALGWPPAAGSWSGTARTACGCTAWTRPSGP